MRNKLPSIWAALAVALASLGCNLVAALLPTPTPPPTANPAPTATSTPRPTRTPTRTPLPTATPTIPPRPGDILLTETFDKNDNGWDTFDDSKAAGDLRDGRYVLEVRVNKTFFWVSPSANRVTSPDVDLTFDVALTEGAAKNATFGALCRVRGLGDFYLFELSGDGYYLVQKSVGGERTILADWKRTASLNTGEATNSIRIICAGDALQLAVNERVLVTLQDGDLREGGIGLMAGTFDQPDVTVAFDNVVLRAANEIDLATAPPPPATAGTEPTKPAAPPTAVPGQGRLTVINTVGFGVRLVLWGPSNQTIDVAGGKTLQFQIPPGSYGWQVFANNCQLQPTSNLAVSPSNTVTVLPFNNQCGYQVTWQSP